MRAILSFFQDPQNKRLIRRESRVLAIMTVPLLFLLVVVGYFHEFVLHAIQANVAINGLIIAAATYGIVLILMRLVSAQVDFYVIERFGREAMQGIYMRQLLEAPWLRRRYVRHYLSHIAQTGGTLSSALDQNAIENELKALSSEYEHKLELPQFLVGFMIAMGLLGTFIGLLETLTGISGMLDGMGGGGDDTSAKFMKLVGELRKPLAGMGIAFSASMFGLVTSLMLAIMMVNLRRYIGRVVSCARNVMHDLTELSHSASQSTNTTHLGPDDVRKLAAGMGRTRSFGAMTSDQIAKLEALGVANNAALQDLATRTQESTWSIARSVDGLTKKIEALLVGVESSVVSTQKMTELLGFGPRMKETSENMLVELRALSAGQAEQRAISERRVSVRFGALCPRFSGSSSCSG